MELLRGKLLRQKNQIYQTLFNYMRLLKWIQIGPQNIGIVENAIKLLTDTFLMVTAKNVTPIWSRKNFPRKKIENVSNVRRGFYQKGLGTENVKNVYQKITIPSILINTATVLTSHKKYGNLEYISSSI